MQMDRCHFWLANFADRAQIEEYLREDYGDDEKPISLFAADQGEHFYDHDWVFVEMSENGSLEELLRNAKIPHATARILRDFAEKHRIQSNAILVADEGEFDNPASVMKDSYSVSYIGCYDLWRHGEPQTQPAPAPMDS